MSMELLRGLPEYLYFRAASMRGQYSLRIGGNRVAFSAPSPMMVKWNRKRFTSEQAGLRTFLHEVEPGDVFFDVGANTGLYTLFVANACADVDVVAFEPYPPNVEILRRDVRRNDLENVRVVDRALADEVGQAEFARPPEPEFGYGPSGIDPKGAGETTTVPVTTGDQLIADGSVPPPTLVKIDVEGAESLVVEGLAEALADPRCRLVICEVHLSGSAFRPSIEDFGESASALRSRFRELGFDVRRLDPRSGREVFFEARK